MNKAKLVFLVFLFILVFNPTAGEFNTTFYSKGLPDGKIPSQLAAIGGMQNDIPETIQGNIHGFVQPEGESKDPRTDTLLPNDQNNPSNVGSAIQNLTNFGGVISQPQSNGIPTDGGFTEWTAFSSCPKSCGRTALRSRERYCTNPAPGNGGKNCEGPRFQLKLCKMTDCPVNGGFTDWTAWSRCSHKCGKGTKHRQRYCTNPAPTYGGETCSGKKREMESCNGKVCEDTDSVVDIDPKAVCGYDPCNVAKCISMPYATCVSDFKCKPVFFDSEERRVDECKGPRLYLTIDPGTVCRFDPCKYTTCATAKPAKCLVNTKCRPVFLDAFGKELDCKGIFKVPARYICGHNPCNSAMCKAEPSARCLVDHACKPVFVNSDKQTYKQCSERGQVVEAPTGADDGEDQDTADQDDMDDSLSRLMKGKRIKPQKENLDSENYVNDEQDTEEQEEEQSENENGEKKSKLPSRFGG